MKINLIRKLYVNIYFLFLGEIVGAPVSFAKSQQPTWVQFTIHNFTICILFNVYVLKQQEKYTACILVIDFFKHFILFYQIIIYWEIKYNIIFNMQ